MVKPVRRATRPAAPMLLQLLNCLYMNCLHNPTPPSTFIANPYR